MKLTPVPHERVWGTSDTQPWFTDKQGRQIGEVWFDVPQSCPLLVKFLFTSADLSVQVHPDNHDEKRGKTEMWHVLRASESARVALGLKSAVTKEQLRAACLDGSVMDLLRWLPAKAGDTFFVPAGTVHALGAGLVVCEIQQNSDCTYRLFDYGRGRELHLDEGLKVATLTPYEGRASLPMECKYFRVARADEAGDGRFAVVVSGDGIGQAFSLSAGELAELPRGELLFASARRSTDV